ncbi:hypothetical protein GCM10010307_09330 [Streptomyces vastus]|uniref:Helix-turn-helix domain-containing protein n=1 Tax=Streptomyces vastus TaxID=285451 RepID=A0ABN3QDM7_9ACTN
MRVLAARDWHPVLVAERVRVREIDDDEGRRLLRIIRRGTGSVVTWRRAQVVLLAAQGMPVAKIAEVTFTSADRVRDVIHNNRRLPQDPGDRAGGRRSGAGQDGRRAASWSLCGRR